DAKQQAPVRVELLGSDDGRFWFRLASNPPVPSAAPVATEFGRMKARVYNGNYTGYSTWNQIANLGKTATPLADSSKEPVVDLTWARPEDDENKPRPFAVIWHGKLVQDRPGAARILVRGVRTAVAVDGRVQLPVGPGNRTVDVWLEAGTHELTIFAATNQGTQTLSALFARANHSTANVALSPFVKTDFDLTQPAAKQAAFPADAQPQVTVADRTWEFQFQPIDLRYVRFVINEYRGEAVAISHIEVAGEEADQRYIPTESDVLSLAKNQVLEIAGGDVVTATYADEHTQSDAGQSRLLTAKLTATYFNANVTPIAYDSIKQANGLVIDIRKELMRIEPGERIVFEIVDFDKDQTNKRDKVRFQVFVNDGDPVTLIATETDKYTGVFTREVDTSAQLIPGKLQVKRGDRIYCRYIDAQNTFPGHAVPREAVVFVNEPSIAQIRLYESRVIPPPEESTARPRLVFQLPPATRKISRVAFEAPLTVEVIDPDAAKDSRSTVTVSLLTTEGVKVDVRCVISSAFAKRPQSATDNWPLREGRFVGQLILQLGGKNSPQDVPLSSEMPRNLIGGPLIEGKLRSQFVRSLTTRVLNLTGKDRISAVYIDKLRPDGKTQNVVARGRLITNGKLAATGRNFEKPAKQLHVGEKLYLLVKDADQDTSDQRDTITVEVSTTVGKEKERVILRETLAHSGVFTASFPLKPNAKPTPNNLDKDRPVIETYFGDTIQLKYLDPAASSEDGTKLVELEIPVVIGTDGLVAAFSKTFNDEKLAVETKFHIAESYFELFKSHKKIGRKNEQQADLKSGRRVLREVIEDYPDPKYVPRIAYLLGQFAQELGQWSEAINSYELIIRQYSEHTLAPDAQYKLAQCYEESGDFDQALEAYVTLAATYPKSPLIADVMLRISDHFYKSKKYNVAAQVGKKFQERFQTHKHAAVMAFRVGQCYFKSEKYKQSSDAFDKFVKQFPDNKLASSAFFWSGESFRLGKNNREAFIRFNNCRWKFPSSEAAKFARGRLSLPEMIQQFEAQAREVENDN
ncbi:MAG: tetratricopeptide repeat protein, partial [Planctomycetes bacterium]|nr:tetratricopeptide repeat protein [Planctomycetota bacterium]